jgi:hypothetical protein
MSRKFVESPAATSLDILIACIAYVPKGKSGRIAA